jgi:uncharacterized protein
MTTTIPRGAPISPCIAVCALDEEGLCRGCLRTLTEITQWTRLSSTQQWAVIAACARRAARVASDAGTTPLIAPEDTKP